MSDDQYDRIAHELRKYNQWVVWTYEQRDSTKPTKVPRDPKTGKLASVSDPNTWSSFEEACAVHRAGNGDGIGFVFTENDPFVGIDLDVAEGQEPSEIQKFTLNKLASYAEFSPSGRGAHSIVKGSVPHGRNSQEFGIEIYPSSRFFTFTGNRINDLDIEDRAAMVSELWHEIGGVFEGDTTEPYTPSNLTDISDEDLVKRIRASGRNQAYYDWTADFNWSDAYRSVLGAACLFSSEEDQVRRVILASPLVTQAPPHGRENRPRRVERLWRREYGYAARVGDLERADASYRIWSRQWFPDGSRELYKEVMAQAKTNAEAMIANFERKRADQMEQDTTDAQRAIKELINAPVSQRQTMGPLPEPPGLLKQITDYICNAATLPNREISLCSAIALMAGIAGRTYLTHTGLGLNLFMLLLVPTGGGKEAAKGGPDRILHAVDAFMERHRGTSGGRPSQMFRPSLFGSYEGILEVARDSPCGLVLYPEFGKVLERATGSRLNENLAGILHGLLDAYSANESGKLYGGKRLSKKENSSGSVVQPSLTILADSQVSTFYNVLSSTFTASGLLPRFMVFEPDVSSPVPNDNQNFVPPEDLVRAVADLVRIVMLSGANQPETSPTHTVVSPDAETREIDREFNRQCIAHYSAMDEGLARDLWTRRRATVLKLAALAAVAVSPANPVLRKAEYFWAHEVVSRGQALLLSRIASGTVGSSSSLERQAIIRVTTDWVRKSSAEKRRELKGRGQDEIVGNGWIPVSWLSNRLDQLHPFAKDNKPRQAVTAALNYAVTDGWFVPVPNETKTEKGIHITKLLYMLGDEFPR